MKRHRIGIICCNSLFKDLSNFTFKEADIVIKSHGINCFSRSAEEILKVLRELSEYCEKIIVLISNCSSAIEREILKEEKIFLVKKDMCFNYLLPSPLLRYYLKEGSFMVHPKWINEWEVHIKERMGLSSTNLARDFFSDSAKKVIVIETDFSKVDREKLKEFERSIGVSAETLEIGSEYIYSFIQNQILSVILELEREKYVNKTAKILKETSDYRFAFEFFKNLHELSSEEDIIERTIELIKLLFDPMSVEYYSVNNNTIRAITNEGGKQKLEDFLHQDRFLKLEIDQINEILKNKIEEDSLLIPVVYRDTVTDFIVVRNLKFKNYMDYYKEFSDFFSHVLSIGLSNQRKINELIEAKARADEASKAKSMFLSKMSHELRTPLNAIIGLSELLRDTSLNKEQIDLIDKIIHSSKILLSLINDILDYSKIEAGELTLSYIEFSIDELISKLKILFEPKASEKRINLYFDIDPQVPYSVIGDELRLNQILMNLLSNAVKFTNRGYVLLRLTVTEKIDDEHATIKFLVEDTGIGISEEGLKRLFMPFSQADITIERRYGGTGLGLAISQILVNAMGGKIDVESKVGKGSRFFFEIPFTVVKWRPPIEENLAGKMRILIVDDDEITRSVLKNYIERYNLGFCEEAEYGYEVIKKVLDANSKGDDYDLVFLDLFLPDMNADQILKSLGELFQKGKLTKIPREFVMISAAERRQLNIDRSKIRYFIQKPITSSSIIDVLSYINPPMIKRTEDKIEIISFTNARVLVAEDNPINQEVIKKLLEKVGIKVEIAWNGAQALDILKSSKEKYDLIIMDINMPELDGYEATERIRKFDDRTPIIALTAAATIEERNRALEVGMNDFITKPIDSLNLYQKLAEYMPEKVKRTTETATDERRADIADLDEKIIDLDALYEIFEEEKNVLTILEKFLLQLKNGNFRNIFETINRDSEQAKRIIHTLKGSSGMAKASLLFKVSAKIYEKLLENKKIDEDELEELRRAYELTHNFITELLKEKKQPLLTELSNKEFKDIKERIISSLMSFSPIDDSDLEKFLNEAIRRGIIDEVSSKEFKNYVDNFDYVLALSLIKKKLLDSNE